MKKNKNLKNFTNILNYIFLTCLAILAFQSIFGQAIFDFDMSSFSFGKILLDFIEKIQYGLVVLAIVSGSLIFYVNREETESVEEEKEKEILEEEKRKKEFEKNFPVLNKVPLFGWIVKWMYKEEWKYSLGLIGIVLVGFLLRLYHLGYILPFSDEYTQLANVKKIYEGIIIEDTRGMSINYIVKFLYDFFGYNINNFFDTYKQGLFLARIPGVIISIITIPIFYLIGKKIIGKKLGIILALLLAFSPMNIEMAKFIREYIYFFFLLTLFVLLFLNINLKKIITKNNIYFAVYTFIVIIISIFIEPLSTLKVIVFFIFAGILSFLILNLKKIFKYKKLLIVGTLIFIGIFILFYSKFSIFLGLNIKYAWLNYFITNKSNYPSGLNNIQFLSLFLILIGQYFILKNKLIKNYRILYFILLFTIFIIFYVYLFNRYIQIRYAFYVFIPFIILLGIGIYFILKNSYKYKITYILIVLSIFSIHTTLYSLNGYKYGKWNKITDHYIENYISTANFIKDNKKNINVLITTYPTINYLAGIEHKRIYHYKYSDKNRFDYIKNITKNNKSGYIILDWRRNGWWAKGLPKKDFTLGGKKVYLISNKNGIQIYRW